MKIRGSHLVVQALEAEGVRFTFGIPGTHNVELYDALADSRLIEPLLVTDEQSASFMADGVSRTSDSIGVVNLVPGAGITHALSGVAEALLDNVPLLVLACGIRADTGRSYQVHDIDQVALMRPVTKEVFSVERAEDIYATVRRAIRLARAGTPGPVAVTIPGNFYFLTQDAPEPSFTDRPFPLPSPGADDLQRMAAMLNAAAHPALYVGNGARGAADLLPALAEALAAPVTTTIQGKGVFPEDHPLWLWNNFGAAAPSFVRRIMDRCDCLLAVGCRFGEVATASYGLRPPENLIHADINADVLGRNFPPAIGVRSDARVLVEKLLPLLKCAGRKSELENEIAEGHQRVNAARLGKESGEQVSPARFFAALQRHAREDAIYTTDSGNGTFLAMEHLRLRRPGRFNGPVDFSCMGYAVPAAIGAKLVNPERDVIALAGDGALLMTGLELLTASTYGAAPAVFVLRDGELGQIVQLQRASFNRDTCSLVGDYDTAALARAVRCGYLKLENDAALDRVISEAFARSRRKEPMLVEVNIDYSEKTYFTKGVMTTNFWRLPWAERLRMAARLAGRKIGRS
jgi:acetolactate synthase-1/2/3 large subunit